MLIVPSRLLSLDEINQVVKETKRLISHYDDVGSAKMSWYARTRLTVFRLSACCGLRAKEICGIDFEDVNIYGPKPVIVIRKTVTKGSIRRFERAGKPFMRDTRRARFIPLHWSWGTVGDLAGWKIYMEQHCPIEKGTPFVPKRPGFRMNHFEARRQWKRALAKALGADRAKQIRLHDGRHSYASHALQAGHSLAAVRDALGHKSIAMTSHYLHAIENDDVPDLF